MSARLTYLAKMRPAFVHPAHQHQYSACYCRRHTPTRAAIALVSTGNRRRRHKIPLFPGRKSQVARQTSTLGRATFDPPLTPGNAAPCMQISPVEPVYFGKHKDKEVNT